MDIAQTMYRTMIWRAILSIVIVAGALAGSLAYVAFYSTGLSLFQKIATVLIALIVACVAVSIVWMAGWSRYMNAKTWKKFKEMK